MAMGSMCAIGSIWKTTWMRSSWQPPGGGVLRRSHFVGGSGSDGTASERINKQVVEAICSALDVLEQAGARIGA